jgi:hypothetical protein
MVRAMTDRSAWLHGWPLMGDTVLFGTGIRCAGCGVSLGVATVAFDGDQWERQEPEWPFEVDNCPVHVRPADRGVLQEIAEFRPAHWCQRRAREALEGPL